MWCRAIGCIGMLTLSLLAAPRAAEAQPPAQLYRIGYLGPGSGSTLPAALDAFRQQLHHLGYVEGQNVAIEYRWAADRDDQLPRLAADLVQLKVDVIVVEGHTPAIQAAKQATSTIPIVMGVSGDPVKMGLVESLARPGGNVTGSTFMSEETVGKLLQLLKEVVPRAARVAVVSNPANPVYVSMLKDVEAMGRQLNLHVVRLGIQGPGDVDGVFDSAKQERLDGLVVMRDFVLITYRERLVELAAKFRMPVMYGMREFVDAGGLMSFEPSLTELYRRAAGLVHKILAGAKPAELPVERSSRFELVVNLKTAKSLGLTIPDPVRLRADQVIE
jgi:putative ABC transport system substrate-binding protein